MGYITIIPWARVGYEVIKITNERVARVGYNHFISNEGEWNNCFSKFSNRVLPPIFVSTILQSVRKENLAHYFSYDVKLRLLAHSRSFLANQKARNAIVGAENLLKADKLLGMLVEHSKNSYKPLACSSWYTNSSRVLPTSRMVYQLINPRNLWSIA